MNEHKEQILAAIEFAENHNLRLVDAPVVSLRYALKQLDEMEQVITFVEQEYSTSYGELLAALEQEGE